MVLAEIGVSPGLRLKTLKETFVSDIFSEVDEEVRREQLKRLWERYGIYIVAAAILFVAAVGGWRA